MAMNGVDKDATVGVDKAHAVARGESADAAGQGYNAKVRSTDDIRAELLRIESMLKVKVDFGKSVNISNDLMKHGTNTKTMFANMLEEMYKLCGKAMVLLDTGTPEATPKTEPASAMTQEISDMVKLHLTTLLPIALKEALSVRTDELPQPVEPVVMTVVATKEPEDQKYLLTLEDKTVGEEVQDESVDKEPWFLATKSGISVKLKNIPSESIKMDTGKKSATIAFTDKESRDEAQKALEPDFTVSSKEQDRPVLKKLQPRLRVDGVCDELLIGEKSDIAKNIKGLICDKNPAIAETLAEDSESLNLVYFDQKKNFIVLRMSPDMRQVIRNQKDKIYLGFESLSTRDHFHVVQCFHCQGYAHKTGECPKKTEAATCLHCAGRHESRNCNFKQKSAKRKCTNCANSRFPAERDTACGHTARDALCPFMINEKEKMIDRTANSTKAKNDYQSWLQRISKSGRKHR